MESALILITFLLLTIATTSHAGTGCGRGDCMACHRLTVAEAGALLKEVGEVKEVSPAPIAGLWQVTLERDGRKGVAFMDFGKRYLLPGPVFPIKPGMVSVPPVKNLTKVDVASIPLSNSLVMGNPYGSRKLVVFTDPDCPFCARFHAELKKLADREPDLAIYIKMYPLKIHPQSYDKARVILGAHSLDLLEKAFAGDPLPSPGEHDRTGPVDESIRLGRDLGITGTPALVLPDGRVRAGFMSADDVGKMIVN